MKAFLAAAAALLLSGTAQAVPYLEVGDAGQTLGTAQSTVSNTGVSLDSISGTYSGTDADLFQIYISDFSTFSASASSPTGELDTQLFLLDASGQAIATNDDGSGSSFQGLLPTGNALYAGLAAGVYYLGIADSGNEPVNSANQLLFATGGNTSVRGAATGVNPTTLADFDGVTYEDVSGPYSIALTGVTTGPGTAGVVPEPAAWAMMIVGLGLIGGTLRRRTRTTTPHLA